MDATQTCENWKHYVGPDQLEAEEVFLSKVFVALKSGNDFKALRLVQERMNKIN